MAIRKILEKGDEVLNKRSKEITEFNAKLHEIIDDMVETMFEANGVGIAAPQIGLLKRVVIVLNVDTEEVYELVNPEIISISGDQRGPEGCLSLPGIHGYVTRPMTVTVKAQNRFGEVVEITGEELTARAFCHEIDHLDGKLFDDLVEEYIDTDEVE